jgi:hypothetical protein
MSKDVLPDEADRAMTIFAWQGEGRWEEILAELDENLRARLDAALLARGWARMGWWGRAAPWGGRRGEAAGRAPGTGGGTA